MGLISFFKKLFKRETREVVEEHDLVLFPSTDTSEAPSKVTTIPSSLQPLPAPPSRSKRERSIIPTADTQIHTFKPPPTAPPKVTTTSPSLQPLPGPPSCSERERLIIPSADTHIHTPKLPPPAPPKVTINPPLQPPPAPPSRAKKERSIIPTADTQIHTSKPPPSAPLEVTINTPSVQPLPVPPSRSEREHSIIPAADTQIHTFEPPPALPKVTINTPLQTPPAPPSRSEREHSIIPTTDTQIHTPKPPPTAPPAIKIIPPSPTTIPYQGKSSQEDLVSSQRVYPPELRRQVDDEVVDSEEGSDCDVPTPSEPVPPYTRFANRPPSDPRAGIACQTGHTRYVQPHPFIPVHPVNLYHPPYMPYQEVYHPMYLPNGPPPPRGPRNPHSREQATHYHSHEASGRRSRNMPAHSRHPLQT